MIIFGWRSIAFRSRGGGGEGHGAGGVDGGGEGSGGERGEQGGLEEREALIRGR